MMAYLTRRQKFSSGGDAIVPQPNPLSQHERNQKVFNDYVGRMKHYLTGADMPEWFVKDLIFKKADELGIELKADGGRIGFKYGGSWADWATNYEDQMTFEEYLRDDTIVKKPHFLDRKADGGRIGFAKAGLAYEGKFKYEDLIKDSDFEDFWKAKVDYVTQAPNRTEWQKLMDEDPVIKGMGSQKAIKTIIKEHKLKPNDYKGIFEALVEEVRNTERLRKGRKGPLRQKPLVSAQAVSNLLQTFKESFKPNVGTIPTNAMAKLLKLPEDDLKRLMAYIEKPYDPSKLHLLPSDEKSRLKKAQELKRILKSEGIIFEKIGGRTYTTGKKPPARWRFKLDKDLKTSQAKLEKLQNSKTFGFVPEKKPIRKYPRQSKEDISIISRESPEYKKMDYKRDSGAITKLMKSLNNALKGMSDKKLLSFIEDNPRLKNLVTLAFDPNAKNIFTNIPLEDLSMSEIRDKVKIQRDHIRGKSTVDFDPVTKKIFDGLDVEYPKNLYLIPQAINNSVKKQVENFVSLYPDRTETIKKIDKYFTDNKLSYYNRATGTYGGMKPSKSAVELGHLGIDKSSQLVKILSGTYLGSDNKRRPILRGGVTQFLIHLNNLTKERGGTSFIDDIDILKTEAKSKGWSLNSFAGVLDFSDSMEAAGIKLPPAVRQAADRIIDIGGKTLGGLGKAAVVIDPIFMGFDEARARRRGAGERDTLQYMIEAFGEGVVNLPTLGVGAGKWVKDKLTGEGKKAGPFDYLPTKPEFKSDILYTPKTFAQENLEKNLKDTPMDERVKNVESDMYSAARYKEPLLASPEYQEILESISREDIEKKLRHEDQLSPYKNIDIEKEEEVANKPTYGPYAEQIKNLKV